MKILGIILIIVAVTIAVCVIAMVIGAVVIAGKQTRNEEQNGIWPGEDQDDAKVH